MTKLCYKCGQEIESKAKYKLYPLEKPYGNLFFHPACILEIGDVDAYLILDMKRLYNYLERSKITKKRADAQISSV